MGQLALIFRDQCVAGPLSIWGPGLASGVGSETRALITGVFTALLDGARVVPDHICGESPRLSALRRQIGHYDVAIEARMSEMGTLRGAHVCWRAGRSDVNGGGRTGRYRSKV